MSDFSIRPAREAKEDGEASLSDEGHSPQRAEQSPKHSNSFWTRALRLLRPASAAQLREDIADALLTETDGVDVFAPEERAMLRNILRFREVSVEDVMVPRADIEAVDLSITVGELMILFEQSGRSRMPVYNDTLDDARGMVHIRDLLSYVARQARATRRPVAGATPEATQEAIRAEAASVDLSRVDLATPLSEAGIVREILFVPPSMLASELLQRMHQQRTQLALVIDEYGGTDGLVSHEDIVEMVVGDIDDEHDDDVPMFSNAPNGVVVADARAELEDLAEALGPDFDIRDKLEDVDTLGGLIASELGRIPVKGEVVQAVPGFEFHIVDADARRVKRVRILRRHPASVPVVNDAPPIAGEPASES
ncbi:MAG: magnesium/cobalt efflux protein [Rhizobiales bacterium 63-7]|uniref:hemolysin family protein n=1 Tax=Rhizobium sp. YJ-22 TaxID=3037556 RepID=UPI00092B6794|nr:hemolysin family protein [Rhizobium sp. YJ-22]MBN9033149.1 HlyC/CorC family transporter [Hyphomicrobiales bacterium]MDG3575369.1 hemolysin family protein [Rhizobium sp. YJ-22]OJU70612.1 MAG: magnesium/cobalt efflux protein [Rhizobiales bacterium 63-7]